jgi:type III pantothenate kinase
VKLLIDIGNTRVKWAFDSGNGLVAAGEAVHRDKPAGWVAEFIASLKEVPESAFAINVAGSAMEKVLADALQERFGLALTVVRTAECFGDIRNGYRSIDQLGADRWAAIVGAWQLRRRPVCVVDAGTAVTIDVVSGAGHHQGGIIVPGLVLMRAALNKDTSDIYGFAQQSEGPLNDGEWFGRDTQSAVERGALFMLGAAIDKAVDEMSVVGDPPSLIVTGGDADMLGPVISHPVEHRPLLVLEGLSQLVAGFGNA